MTDERIVAIHASLEDLRVEIARLNARSVDTHRLQNILQTLMLDVMPLEAQTTSLAHHFVTMAWNNAWANHRLLGAIARLSREDFVAMRTSFFPSLKATLNHIVTVDWYYVDALERGLRAEPANADAIRAFFDPEEPFADAASLRAAQREVDLRLVRTCTSLAENDLDRPIAIVRSRGVQHESVTRLLAHLFEHQIHHRGQAHAMLAGTPVAPPQLDEFFCANDASLRTAELAELGTSEAAIWAV